jgi:hypothetical protein
MTIGLVIGDEQEGIPDRGKVSRAATVRYSAGCCRKANHGHRQQRQNGLVQHHLHLVGSSKHLVMCAETPAAARCSGFTIGLIGRIMVACPS